MLIQKLSEEKLTIKELMSFMQLNGLSNKELADILGITYQAVGYWLDGSRDITLTMSRVIKMFIKYPRLLREFGR